MYYKYQYNIYIQYLYTIYIYIQYKYIQHIQHIYIYNIFYIPNLCICLHIHRFVCVCYFEGFLNSYSRSRGSKCYVPQGIGLNKSRSEASQAVYIFLSKFCLFLIFQSIYPCIHPYMLPHIHACMHTDQEVSAWLRNAAGAIKNNKAGRNFREMF